MFNPRTTATVLAALSYWQQDLKANEAPPISEHFQDHTPLTSEEIDTLCEEINCSPDNDWIPVTTRLPDADTSVIACTDEDGIGEAYLDGEEWFWAGHIDIEGSVTHWQHLPEPPNEDEIAAQHALRQLFHNPVATVADAQNLLRSLLQSGLSYHPEDSAADCIGHLITPAECAALDARMEECHALEWTEAEGGCPCGYILSITA